MLTYALRSPRALVLAGVLASLSGVAVACAANPTSASERPASVDRSPADMRSLVDRFEADRGAVQRMWRVELSAERAQRTEQLVRDWRAELDRVDFDALDRDGRIDWILLGRELDHETSALELRRARLAEMQPLVPFVAEIAALAEERRTFEDGDPERSAARLDALAKEIAELRKQVDAKPDTWSRTVGKRASDAVRTLREELGEWYRFGQGYDPVFGWWVTRPWQTADQALDGYANALRDKVARLSGDDDRTILGDPIGRAALVRELDLACIPYTPEELVEIAQRELAWCRAEMLKASREMGCGDDWKQALERVKQDHVGPGGQPALIRDLAREAVAFVEQHELVTVPELAKESWRMEMMSPERQRSSPFFTGGEVISVSYPTDAMTHEEKRMSMRGNNVHFSRATVQHELIPGHHLQQFMTQRFLAHRRTFGTPFWTEGWAFYWETLLWDHGFVTKPEDRVGMLFWRMHRSARVRFSLGFHLGELTPQQCIDLLVDEVGHERENAEAEVRRSFAGGYEPLYQCAYLLGALQFRALHRELVDSGRMTDRTFHDAVLHSGTMPVELVRARLEPDIPLTRTFRTSWRFDQ